MLRKDMNILLEIARDKDIVLKPPPSNEEVEAFAEETGRGPKLHPMRLCFNATVKHAWNADLAEQFVTNCRRFHKIREEEEPLLYELFEIRFSTLKRRYRQWQLRRGEDATQHAQRVQEMDKEDQKLRRRDTRRNNVS